MGKQNLAVNRLLERKTVFADLMNGALFEGRQVLKADQLEQLSVQSGLSKEEEDGKVAVLERRGDVRMRARTGVYRVILAIETQSRVHYAMPVRNMLYDALEYVKQVQELEKKHREAGDRMEGHAFLSGIQREDRLQPVITMVLYVGKDWDGRKSIYELLDLDETDENVAVLRPYLPDYKINIIHAQHIEHPERFQTCLQQIFHMLKYNQDKKHLYQYIKENRDALNRMDDVETRAAFVLLGEQKRVEKLFREREEGETLTMCKAIDDLMQDSREEGREEGENRMLALVGLLLRDNRQTLIARIASDLSLREQLYRQYQI